MTIKTTNDLVSIVEAGGGLDLDVSMRFTPDLVKIASAALKSGATVILRNIGMRVTHDLVEIAQAGGGRVIFVFD
jgi:hypothetical protein